MSLPIYSTSVRELSMLQTQWASQINPVLANPILNNNILKNVSLVAGSNTINHLLSRKLQGWIIVRQRALASIYDNQDSNPNPAQTLILTSNNPVVVDLVVF